MEGIRFCSRQPFFTGSHLQMRKWMFVDRKQCALFCASSGQHGTYCVGNVTRETGFILMILPAKRPRCKSVITQGYRRWIGQKIADFLLPRHSRRCWTWQPRDDCQLATDSVFFFRKTCRKQHGFSTEIEFLYMFPKTNSGKMEFIV